MKSTPTQRKSPSSLKILSARLALGAFRCARNALCIVLLAELLSGCSTAHLSERQINDRAAALTKEITALCSCINTNEAVRTANTSIRYPLELARQYHAMRPAVVNNVFINMGLHPRGLCYQWADDLTAKLMTLHLQTVQLHRGVAALATPHEHSCVVITAPGQKFDQGIALDAWRHAGELAWSIVHKDKFKWKEVELTLEYQHELRNMADKLEAVEGAKKSSATAMQ